MDHADLIHRLCHQICLDRNLLLSDIRAEFARAKFSVKTMVEILLYIWSDLWFLLLLKLLVWISDRSFRYTFHGQIQNWWFQKFSWSPLLVFLSKLESIRWSIWWSLRRESQFGEMMVGHMLKVSGCGLIEVLWLY